MYGLLEPRPHLCFRSQQALIKDESCWDQCTENPSHGFQSVPYHSLPVQSWPCHFISLCLRKMAILRPSVLSHYTCRSRSSNKSVCVKAHCSWLLYEDHSPRIPNKILIQLWLHVSKMKPFIIVTFIIYYASHDIFESEREELLIMPG